MASDDRSECDRRPRAPRTADELIEVLDTMRAALGPPEAMESPRARAIYLLDCTRLAALSQSQV